MDWNHTKWYIDERIEERITRELDRQLSLKLAKLEAERSVENLKTYTMVLAAGTIVLFLWLFK